MTYDEILSRLEGVRRTGNQASARCPAHEDKTASLSVSTGQDGRILLNCNAGCTAEQITAALGLSVHDLFPESVPYWKKSARNRESGSLGWNDTIGGKAGCEYDLGDC